MRASFPDLTIDGDMIEGSGPKGKYLREMFRLPFLMKKGKYDLAHGHFGPTLICLLFVRTAKVITFQGADLLVNPTKHVSRLLTPHASWVIIVSQRLRGLFPMSR